MTLSSRQRGGQGPSEPDDADDEPGDVVADVAAVPGAQHVGTGRERATYKWPIGRVYSLAFAPDGLRLAAGGDEGRVVVWDLE